jgi:hypothetical protein
LILEEPWRVSGRVEGAGGVIVALSEQRLGLVPVTAALRDATVGGSSLVPGFYELSVGLADWASDLSRSGKVGYLHSEFHGGSGFHAAMGWSAGAVAWGPEFTANEPQGAEYRIVPPLDRHGWAANGLLRWLGVHSDGALDEFDVAGLGQVRWTEEWVPSPSE